MRKIFGYKWAILWAVLMLSLFLWPSPSAGGFTFFEGFDKIVHCGLFFVFAALLLHGKVRSSKTKVRKFKTGVSVLMIGALFAFLTEGAQLLTDSRSADWWDIFADMVGTSMAEIGRASCRGRAWRWWRRGA